MNFKNIANCVTRKIGRMSLLGKKYAPEGLIVLGVVGVVTTVVVACKATLKAEPILDEHENKLKRIEEEEKIAETSGTKFTEEEKGQLIVEADKTMYFSLAKLYAPAAGIGFVSITCFLISHGMIKKRYLSAVAAYTAVDGAFKEYRRRVRAEEGVEKDRHYRYGTNVRQVIEDDGNGNTTVTEEEYIENPSEYSLYAKIFDESNPNWTKDPEQNRFFLQQKQNILNDRLRCVGHLFLNEVYDELGIEKTVAGQTIGWIYDEKNPIGDNFVDFGIFNVQHEAARAFVNGTERSIILDFNVDGPILERVPLRKV